MVRIVETRVVDPMRVQPRGDQVLVRRLADAEATAGGIIMPEQFQHDFFHAEVLKIGPGGYDGGVRCPANDLAVGDIVLVDEERRSPDGIKRIHLLPVTPDETNVVLVLELHIRAIIRPA